MKPSPSHLFATTIYATLTHAVLRAGRQIDRSLCSTIPVGSLRQRLNRYRKATDNLAQLANLLEMPVGALPQTSGPAGSPDFLLLMAQTIFAERPKIVVEFGSGVSSFVIARSLQIIGTGRLLSFDHSESFAEITRRQIAQQGLSATIRVVPLRNAVGTGDRGMWYQVDDLPEVIDMIVVDGPPSSVHPETRSGAGSATFANLRKGGVVFLDDACREGERRVVNRWRLDHPEIEFIHLDTAKGTVVGRKIGSSACEDMAPDLTLEADATGLWGAKEHSSCKVGRSDGQPSK